MATPLGSGHLRIRRGLWERKSPGFKGRVLFPDPSIFCFRLSVGSPQLLQEPEILSGAQNPRVQCWNALPQATHSHWWSYLGV